VCKKPEAVMKLEAQIVVYLGSINLLLGLYQMYTLPLNSICITLSNSDTDSLPRKLKALAEQRARRRFESLTTTLANMQIQTRTVIEDVAYVREQVEEGTRVVRKDIEESSKETCQALQRLQQHCVVTVSGFLKTAGTLSEVTLQT
jgi:hypothetical protein